MTTRTAVPTGALGELVIASWQVPFPFWTMRTVLAPPLATYADVGAAKVALPTAVLPHAQSGPLPEPHVPIAALFR